MDIKKSLKDVIVLLVICSVFAVVLAAVNSVTAPIIADRLAAAADEAYLAVMPGATGFEDADISGLSSIPTVKEAKKEKSGLGYVIKLETKGYAPGMVLIVGVSADGVVTGATCIASNETWGFEATLGEQFVGKDSNTVADVEAGATSLTKNAYRAAVKDAINAATILGGGVADTRTEEEIFFDNLKEALPEAFTDAATKYDEVFTEALIFDNDGKIYSNADLGVKSINKAQNGAGYVFVVEKEFVAVNAEGVIVSEASDEAKAIVEAALVIKTAAGATEIDITEYQNSEDRNIKRAFKSILSLNKTAAGNYVFEVKGSGYGSDPIILLVTINAEGKTIDLLAVSHSETGSFGGEKLEGGYYDDFFVGKTEADCNGVDFDTIKNGATVTSNGVQKAITNCFTAFNILEGGTTNE